MDVTLTSRSAASGFAAMRVTASTDARVSVLTAVYGEAFWHALMKALRGLGGDEHGDMVA